MRVSFSVSFRDFPLVLELLKSCELIYTTQAHNRDALYELFGSSHIRFIPDCTPAMLEFLKARHKDDEVYQYPDLYAMTQKYIAETKQNNSD
jgi:hypothetical protein